MAVQSKSMQATTGLPDFSTWPTLSVTTSGTLAAAAFLAAMLAPF